MSTILRNNTELQDDMNQLWSWTITPRTSQVYTTGLTLFLRFVSMHGIQCYSSNLPPISEELLLLFITFCHKRLYLRESTIRLYLAGIRYNYLKAGLPNPWQSQSGVLVRVNLILKGIKRNQGISQRTRLPFTADIVFIMCSTLKAGLFTPFLDALMQAAVLIAFFGFLRCAEFTTLSNKFDKKVHVCIEDLTFQNDTCALLHLKSSKTDRFRQGVVIKYFRNPRMCPVHTLQEYLSRRYVVFPQTKLTDPLFVTEDMKPLTRAFFLQCLNRLLNVIGLDPSKYSGHSFRIGAATSAATAGLQDHMIKTLGRWTSDAYNRYIHTSEVALKRAFSTLVDSF